MVWKEVPPPSLEMRLFIIFSSLHPVPLRSRLKGTSYWYTHTHTSPIKHIPYLLILNLLYLLVKDDGVVVALMTRDKSTAIVRPCVKQQTQLNINKTGDREQF